MSPSSRLVQSQKHWAIEVNPFRTAAVRPGAIPFCCVDENLPMANHNKSFGLAGISSKVLATSATLGIETVADHVCSDTQSCSPSLMDRLSDSFLDHRSGQILGEHGSGKSTLVSSLVEHLQPRFRSTQRLCFVRPEFSSHPFKYRFERFRHCRIVSKRLRQMLATCLPGTLLVIDGAEQLSMLAYHQLLVAISRNSISVLATSHRKLRHMPVLFRTQVSPSMICDLTLRQVCQSSSAVRGIVETDLMSRELEAITSVRDYWFELYDLVQPHLQPCNSYREQHCG